MIDEQKKHSLLERVKTRLHLSWLYTSRFASEKRRWRSVGQFGYRNPRVYYGHDFIPSRKEKSGGAIIKFQDLEEKFPNFSRNANILYLVSSALPIFPEVMVREAKKHGTRFILNQNGVAYPAWHGSGWEKSNEPMRILLELADFVIYQSGFCKVGADKFLGSCRVPWTVLYNPVNTKMFVPAQERPPGFRILLAGSHQHLYRIRTALETLKKVLDDIPLASLTIAGRYTWRPSEQECLQEAGCLAQEIGIYERVRFIGGYTQVEAIKLFQEHHILLHTQYNDCCPRLVVEAMACGLPIVYSHSGGVPELVGDSAGVGVPAQLDWERSHPPQSYALARAMRQVVASLDNYSTTARKRAVARFDVAPWIEKHDEIFKDLLCSKA